MVEGPHGDPHRPHICSFAGVPVRASKLVLGGSEPWRSCGEVRNIILLFIPHCCKIYDHNLIALLLRFSGNYVVDFDISVGDVVRVEVLYGLTHLNEYYSCDICQITSFIFYAQVLVN